MDTTSGLQVHNSAAGRSSRAAEANPYPECLSCAAVCERICGEESAALGFLDRQSFSCQEFFPIR